MARVTGPVLAFDTATDILSVAVLGPQGELLAEVAQRAPRLHSAQLVPTIERVLKLSGVGKGDLSAVAANRGPGSYTGLRIGLSAAQAFSLGLEIPAYGVPGLLAAAAAQAQDGLVAPCLDARRGDAFCALYEVQGGKPPKEVIAQGMRSMRDLVLQAGLYGRPVLFLGDALHVHGGMLQQSPWTRLGPRELRAADLGRFALRAREEAKMADALSVTALYLRPPAIGARGIDG